MTLVVHALMAHYVRVIHCFGHAPKQRIVVTTLVVHALMARLKSSLRSSYLLSRSRSEVKNCSDDFSRARIDGTTKVVTTFELFIISVTLDWVTAPAGGPWPKFSFAPRSRPSRAPRHVPH